MRPQTVRVEDTDREKWNEGLQRGGGFVSTGVTSGIPNLEMTAKNGATWSVQDALGLYNIENWGADYFSVNEKGAVTVAPLQSKGATIAVMEVLDEALRRGMGLPILIRFQDLLRHRVESVNEAFKAAIAENGFKGTYFGVFPIKVNQLREVVEEVTDAGKPYHYGLEVGSKPELFAALAIHQDPESLIICNGYKDPEFVRAALLGRRLGKKVILVIEKLEEVALIIQVAREVGVEPMLGVRVRLLAKGGGKWAQSGGENAKFGLSTTDLLEAMEILKREKMEPFLKLLHFHIGSQIPDIAIVKRAVREAARYYAKLHQLGWAIEYFDGSASIVEPSGIAAASQGATTLVLVRTALVRLAAGHAEDVKGDLKSGCGLVIGPTLVGGWYLLAFQPPADQLIEAAGDGSAGSAGSMIAAARGLRDIEVGLLRAERDLVRSADLTAARSDPLIDIELVGLLA